MILNSDAINLVQKVAEFYRRLNRKKSELEQQRKQVSKYLLLVGEMLKFLHGICAVVALGVVSVLAIPMDMDSVTTNRPEATTEDTTGRLLSLPDPVKCANSKYK